MADLDYYTVMERSIRYYANKYDPYDRLLTNQKKSIQSARTESRDNPPDQPIKKRNPPRKKILTALFSF